MSPREKVILAVFAGLAASALARFSYGPSSAETYTSGFVYWLNYYSGFDFGVVIAAIVLIVNWDSLVLVSTKRMLALATASQIASASAASFFCRLT